MPSRMDPKEVNNNTGMLGDGYPAVGEPDETEKSKKPMKKSTPAPSVAGSAAAPGAGEKVRRTKEQIAAGNIEKEKEKAEKKKQRGEQKEAKDK